MVRENGIEVNARVLGLISDHLARVELPNGHQIFGYVCREDEENFKNRLVRDAQVVINCSPFDFSKGRIKEILNRRIGVYEGKTISKKTL